MPFMQAFVERLNTRFNSTNIVYVNADLLAVQPTATTTAGNILVAAAAGSTAGSGAIKAQQMEKDYINDPGHFSSSDLEALRGILYWAVTQSPRVPVQFLWVPDAGYHIEFCSVAGTGPKAPIPSGPGISVLIKGPSPAAVLKQYP